MCLFLAGQALALSHVHVHENGHDTDYSVCEFCVAIINDDDDIKNGEVDLLDPLDNQLSLTSNSITLANMQHFSCAANFQNPSYMPRGLEADCRLQDSRAPPPYQVNI